jgi:hypothetical protein
MRPVLRLLVLGCAGAASFALAGNALAKTPQLIVSGSTTVGASAATVVEVKEETTDAAPLRISIYVPLGYSANLSQAAGTQIGTVNATFQVLQISQDAVIDVQGGTVLTDTPSKYLSNTCAPGTHAAVWLLHAMVSGAVLDVPVYVDPTTAAEATFSSAKLVLCLANPYEQATPPSSRAASGAKIIDAKMTLSAGVFTNPPSSGSHVWRTVITPWTANGATPNAAGTIEAQSIVTIPSTLPLKAKVRTIRHKKRGRTTVTNSVLLSGKLLENLKGVADARVTFFANGKTAGSATTGATGSFSKRVGLGKKTSFKATATVPTRETACVSPLGPTVAPAGCVAATLAGYKIGSDAVTATPRNR